VKHERLHALTDGIFAIAMTLLVFNLHVPVVNPNSTSAVWHALTQLTPSFLSFILSFAVLFTYWRGHNFVVSNLAQNIDVPLTNYNAFFLLLVVLVPFSAEFLGRYHDSEIAIVLYGVNIIAISSTLIFMRNYIIKADNIENNPAWTDEGHRNSFIRMAVPSVSAALAIVVGFWSKDAALAIFTLAVVASFSRSSITLVRKVVG
jgi:uncharacterized membrane protein